jgi:hypothetical protein
MNGGWADLKQTMCVLNGRVIPDIVNGIVGATLAVAPVHRVTDENATITGTGRHRGLPLRGGERYGA